VQLTLKKPVATPLKLSWEEIGLIAQGLTLASRPLKGATRAITEEYALGPRGAWILRLIETGQVVHPLDVTNFFHISRSVITEELAQLTQRRLIAYRKSNQDRRRVELTLTRLGETVSLRVQEELKKLISERFSAYSREEVLQFNRILHSFVFFETDETKESKNKRPQPRRSPGR
jgi:DNA-binding MarR family transcriptional regulator